MRKKRLKNVMTDIENSLITKLGNPLLQTNSTFLLQNSPYSLRKRGKST